MIKILLFFVACVTYSQNVLTDSIIYWDENRKLKKEDFKLFSPRNHSIENNLAISNLSFEITVDSVIEGIPYYKVKSVFNKNKSWIKDNQETVLRHEQVHFDIFEIYARKIQLEFKRLNINKNKNKEDYINIYKRLFSECLEINNKFDQESNQGSFWGTENSNDNQIVMTENIEDYVKLISINLPNWEKWIQDNFKKIENESEDFLTISSGKFFDNGDMTIITRNNGIQTEVFNSGTSKITCEIKWKSLHEYELKCIDKDNVGGCLRIGDIIKVSIESVKKNSHTVIYSNERCGNGKCIYFHSKGW